MLVTVGDLINSTKKSSIQLIAGENGLNNVVRWVHIVENIQVSTFLEGGEIALITGIGLDSTEELLPLVKCIKDNGGSAVIVNTGPHITSIGDDVRDYCSQNNMPLFTVPWHIHIAEVMRTLCSLITSAGQKDMELSAALKSLVNDLGKYSLYTDILAEEGFFDDCFYCTAVFDFYSESIDRKYIDMLNDSIQGYFSHTANPVHSFILDNRIVLIFRSDALISGAYAEDIVESAAAHTYGSGFNHQLLKGIGSCVRGLGNIAKSFKEAEAVINLNRKSLSAGTLFEKTGIYRLLYSINDEKAKQDFIQTSIGRVLEYDRENKSDLAQLLKNYIKNNGSVQETALKMSVHRNTINYKIKKIESITGMNLSEFENRQIMDIGFKLYDIMN